MKNVHDFCLDERMIRCLARITISKGIETYCQLEQGHSGAHSTGEVTSNPSPSPGRCPSRFGAAQCGLPERHYGEHQASLKTWPQEYLKV